MDDPFFKHWFGGLEKALLEIDPKSREKVFRECGKACSASYTRQVFQDEYSNSTDLNDFFNRLTRRFSELQLDVIEENRIFILTYTYCACELVRKGFMRSGQLCDCSQFSLQENLEAVVGKGNVRVKLLESILRGNEHCKLRIEFKP